VALVVLRRPVTQQVLMAFCRSPIDGSRLPVAIVEVPRMLRSPDGKILRNHLIDEYKVVAP